MTRATVLAGLAIAALLVVATWWLASSPAPAPPGDDASPAGSPAAGPSPPATATPAATTPPAPSPTGRPSPATTPTRPGATPSPSPPGVAPPTPSPAAPPADAAPLVGVAETADASGDLLDTAGSPPPRAEPAADLVGVRLSGDGDELVVTWSLAGDVPASTSSLVWSLDVWSDGSQRYTITVQQVGARRVAGVLDWETGAQHAPGDPVVESRTVRLRVPAALLERVDGPFQWQALGQLDGGYEDYVPADGTLTWFPAPGA